MDLPRGIVTAVIFALGACIGSLVDVVAYRLPRNISIVTPRSFCANCGKKVRLWANVPVLAYIALGGRCVDCAAPIPFRYFLTEVALGSAALYLYLHFTPLDALARFVLCAGLFVVGLIDYDWRVIPSAITFPGILIGVMMAWLVMPEVGWKSSLGGVLLGAGFLFLTGEVYRRIRGREGVGLGDVWLLAMVGAFLGWPGALFTLFFGSVLGTLGGVAMWTGQQLQDPNRAALAANTPTLDAANDATMASQFLQTEIPFGPFLALAAGIFALFQPMLTQWYFS
jgi:leader peptidase (prepilin peptidase)/N-methyltransferase